MKPPVRFITALLAALALLATACGTEGSSGSESATNADIDDLAESDDVRLLEVLDVETGEPATLAATVTGDRPVLLWFWAPH